MADEPEFGSPKKLFHRLAARRPPGPLFTGRAFRSPLRGPWLTSVFGAVLLVLLPVVARRRPVVALTGLLSYIAYRPQFASNAFPGDTHGLHLPFFAWPPARSFAQVLERCSVLLLVGSILFEMVTGLLNIQYHYVFGFDFYAAHYYGAWGFIASFVLTSR